MLITKAQVGACPKAPRIIFWMGRVCRDSPSRQGSLGGLETDTQQGSCSQDALIPHPNMPSSVAQRWQFFISTLASESVYWVANSLKPLLSHSLGPAWGGSSPGLGSGSLSISLVRFACKAILKKQFLAVLPAVLARTHEHWDRVRRGCGAAQTALQVGDKVLKPAEGRWGTLCNLRSLSRVIQHS